MQNILLIKIEGDLLKPTSSLTTCDASIHDERNVITSLIIKLNNFGSRNRYVSAYIESKEHSYRQNNDHILGCVHGMLF